MANGDFKQLTVERVEEGELLNDLNVEFLRVQETLMNHVARYKDGAVGAKAKITLEIELKVTIPDAGVSVAVTSKIKTTSPARPAKSTTAIGDTSKKGMPTLICRTWGTSYDSPNQGVIDFDTGEVLDTETMKEED